MYQKGLGLKVLGQFHDHDGFDGMILGAPGAEYHLEFTHEKQYEAPRSPSHELLLVFYLPDPKEWETTIHSMVTAGFVEVKSHNPYWDKNGRTFEDIEGYRVVISQENWGR